MKTDRKLSKEAANRMLIWHQSLRSAYSYMMVEKHLADRSDTIDSNCRYELDGMPCYAHAAFVACGALMESALILVCLIFTTGNAGPGISGNKDDIEVDGLKLEMKGHVKTELSWTDDQYDGFVKLLLRNRNKFLAHYDGKSADYRELAQGITSMKAVGVHLNSEERDSLIRFVGALSGALMARLRDADAPHFEVIAPSDQ